MKIWYTIAVEKMTQFDMRDLGGLGRGIPEWNIPEECVLCMSFERE